MNAEEQLKGYISKIFGPMVGERLLKQNLKKLGIGNIASLNVFEQSQVMEKMITVIFKKHLKDEELNKILLEMKINFSLDNSIKSISERIKDKTKIKEITVYEKKKEEIPFLFEAIDKVTNIIILVTIHGDMNGIGIMFFDKLVSMDIARHMTKIMTGKDSMSKEMDEMARSALTEFFNILFSEFLKIANIITQKNIHFVLDLSNAHKIDEYMPQLEESIKKDTSITKVYSTNLEMSVGTKDLKGKAFLLM